MIRNIEDEGKIEYFEITPGSVLSMFAWSENRANHVSVSQSNGCIVTLKEERQIKEKEKEKVKVIIKGSLQGWP